MRKGKKFGVLLMCMFFLVMCFGMIGCKAKESNEAASTVPSGCENSLIYKKFKNPVVVDSIMQLVTLETVKKGILSAENVKIFYTSLDALLLDEHVTYSDFFGVLQSQVKALASYSAEFAIAANTLDSILEPIKIDACDLKMLHYHIEHQLSLLKAFEASGKK